MTPTYATAPASASTGMMCRDRPQPPRGGARAEPRRRRPCRAVYRRSLQRPEQRHREPAAEFPPSPRRSTRASLMSARRRGRYVVVTVRTRPAPTAAMANTARYAAPRRRTHRGRAPDSRDTSRRATAGLQRPRFAAHAALGSSHCSVGGTAPPSASQACSAARVIASLAGRFGGRSARAISQRGSNGPCFRWGASILSVRRADRASCGFLPRVEFLRGHGISRHDAPTYPSEGGTLPQSRWSFGPTGRDSLRPIEAPQSTTLARIDSSRRGAPSLSIVRWLRTRLNIFVS